MSVATGDGTWLMTSVRLAMRFRIKCYPTANYADYFNGKRKKTYKDIGKMIRI